MAVSKRKNRAGVVTGYQVTAYVPDPATGTSRRVIVGTFTRRKEADAAERKAKIAIDAGTFTLEAPAPPRVVTVEDACRVWLSTKAMQLRPNTIAGYEIALTHHLLPEMGSRDVATITHDDVQSLVNSWHAAGKGAQTINRATMILRGALDRQVRAGVIAANPAAGVVKPSPKARKELTTWTDEETGRFLAVAASDRLAPFWYLTLLEGMRRGEALGLRWSDLRWSDDEAECVATISRTIVPDNANGGAAMVQEGQAKTRASRRSVMLTAPTVAILKAHRDRQRFERQQLAEVWSAGDAILTTSIGTIPNPTAIKTHLRDLLAAADVPQVTTHVLRHMAATRMLRAGVSPALVAQKLGHSDIGTTVGTYGHLVTADQAEANRAIEASIAKATGT